MGRGRLNRRAIVSRGDAGRGRLGYQVCLLADRLTSPDVHRLPIDDFQDLREASEGVGVFEVFRGVVRSTPTYFKLLHRLETELGRRPGPHRIKIMDATYVPVCDSLFPWADFMPGKSAVKLHFLLDADAGAPQELQVTSGQVHELEVARKLSFAPARYNMRRRSFPPPRRD